MRGFTQNRQIGTALPLAAMNQIRRQNGGDARRVGVEHLSHGVIQAVTLAGLGQIVSDLERRVSR